jgi:hypothetical protein
MEVCRRPRTRRLDVGGGLPVTRPLRSVDLARARTDGGHLASVIRDAILGGTTSFDEIAEALHPYAHRYGAPLGNLDVLHSTLSPSRMTAIDTLALVSRPEK